MLSATLAEDGTPDDGTFDQARRRVTTLRIHVHRRLRTAVQPYDAAPCGPAVWFAQSLNKKSLMDKFEYVMHGALWLGGAPRLVMPPCPLTQTCAHAHRQSVQNRRGPLEHAGKDGGARLVRRAAHAAEGARVAARLFSPFSPTVVTDIGRRVRRGSPAR